MSARRGPGPLFAAALLGLSLPACFFQPRSDEEIFDVPFSSDETCEVDSTCDDGNPCTTDRCVQGDYAGGYCVYEADDSLIPDDRNPCTLDTCIEGDPEHGPLPAGAPCGQGGALACDGDGLCVGCGGDATNCGPATECLAWDCPSDACKPVYAGYGKLLAQQTQGDCASAVCDGKGGVTDAWNESDGQIDPETPCVRQACSSYGGSSLAPPGTPCGDGCWASGAFAGTSPGACDINGSCTPTQELMLCAEHYHCGDGQCKTTCATDADCFGAKCQMGACSP